MEAAVAGKQHRTPPALRQAGADSGAHAKTHRPQAAAGQEGARAAEAVVQHRPHLVLADIGGHQVMAFHPGADALDDVLGLQQVRLHIDVIAFATFELPDAVHPLGAGGRVDPAFKHHQHLLHIAQNFLLRADIL